jgi:hypothetical protein
MMSVKPIIAYPYYIHTRITFSVYNNTHVYIHAHKHIYIRTYIKTYIHTYAHTQTRMNRSVGESLSLSKDFY